MFSHIRIKLMMLASLYQKQSLKILSNISSFCNIVIKTILFYMNKTSFFLFTYVGHFDIFAIQSRSKCKRENFMKKIYKN